MLLLVTYKISADKRNYSGLYEAIKASPATSWWHYIDSTWLVRTNESPAAMTTRLRAYLDDAEDSLLILKIDNLNEYSGWLPQKAWEWIKANK
jgi:hypothetical protein